MATTESYAAANLAHYVWWFPGSPVRIHLSLDVIRRLKEQLPPAGSSPAREGLLFGRMADSATEILAFQPVTGSIPEAVDAISKEDGNRLLVGYYRTEAGGNLRLNENDLLVARTAFTQPYHVFLIIQPTGFGPPNAGFFFHDSDGKMAELSLMEFPFEPSLLVDEERDRLKRSQEAAARRSAAVQPPPPQLPAQPRRVAGRRVLVSALALLAVAVCGAGIWAGSRSLLEWWQRIHARISPPPPAQQPAQTLSALAMGLRARRENADVNITWNRKSPAIVAATSGLLTIKDGTVTRNIALDAFQVHQSSIMYAPSSEQVSIQLSITTPVSTVIESVMLLLPQEGLPSAR